MLTKNREIVSRKLGLRSHPVAAGAVIFSGAMVALNAAGFAVPATSVAGLRTQGRATYGVDNTGGPDGAAHIESQSDMAQRYDNDAVSPVTRADIDGDCYVLDDHTVSSDGTNRSVAGKVSDVDADGVWVDFT